jgi:hypothetical protein
MNRTWAAARFGRSAASKINGRILGFAVVSGVLQKNINSIIPDRFPWSLAQDGLGPVFGGVGIALATVAVMDLVGILKSEAVANGNGRRVRDADFVAEQEKALYDNIELYPDVQNTGKDIENNSVNAAQTIVMHHLQFRAPLSVRIREFAEDFKLFVHNRQSKPAHSQMVAVIFRRLFDPQIRNSFLFARRGSAQPSKQAVVDDLILQIDAIDGKNYRDYPQIRDAYHDGIEAIAGVRPDLEGAKRRRDEISRLKAERAF